MKNRKIIHSGYQENIVECDNCDYVVPNPTKDPYVDGIEYVNKPCPQCGYNLLTKEDYNQYKVMMKMIDKINKWFGWLSWFGVGKGTEGTVNIKVRDGIKIKKS